MTHHPYLAKILHNLLPQALEDNLTIQSQEESISLRQRHASELIITSGRIIAWDPLWIDERIPPFAATVAPGKYPVVLSIAQSSIAGERLAYATLRLQDRQPVRWEVARFDDDEISLLDENEDVIGYPVDTGIGCFADLDAARVFMQRLQEDAEYHMVIVRGMDESDPLNIGWGWGSVDLKPDTLANLIFFTAGEGDGTYASYFGFDADDMPVCLITDFGLLWHLHQ